MTLLHYPDPERDSPSCVPDISPCSWHLCPHKAAGFAQMQTIRRWAISFPGLWELGPGNFGSVLRREIAACVRNFCFVFWGLLFGFFL